MKGKPLPDIVPQAQVFGFRPLGAVNITAVTASCLPHDLFRKPGCISSPDGERCLLKSSNPPLRLSFAPRRGFTAATRTPQDEAITHSCHSPVRGRQTCYERRALPELLIFFITATGGFGSAARFDLRRGDSVPEAVFAPCVYASAGSTSEGGVSAGEGGGGAESARIHTCYLIL